MVILKASDGVVYEVEETVAKMLQMLSPLIDDADLENAIPLHNVTGKILGKVLDYCKKHTEEEAPEDLPEEDDMSHMTKKHAMEKWDAEYVDVDRETLFEIVLAANYLEIKGLLELTCQKIADLIKDVSTEEVREVFNIENDYSEEEEAEMRNEYPWAYEEEVSQQ
ncbi:SKP1-like protein 1A [Nymphaea colorata]|nr:SKP1-like protein 1A [Nymphaea colorata]